MEEIQNEQTDGAGDTGTETTSTQQQVTEKPAKKAKASKGKAKAGKRGKVAKVKQEKSLKTEKSATQDRQPPKVGTVLEKKDRHGKVVARCTVEKDGFKYKGKLYSSLSAAGQAANEDNGNKGAINGWLYWQLIAAPSATDPVDTLQRLSARYTEKAKAALATADDDTRAKIEREIEKHSTAVARLVK